MIIKKYVRDDSFDKWEDVFEEEESDDYNEKYKIDRDNFEDMLTGVMQHLDTVGGVEFAILKDPKLGKWWAKKSKEIERLKKIQAAKEKLRKTLSEEERQLLGIRI